MRILLLTTTTKGIRLFLSKEKSHPDLNVLKFTWNSDAKVVVASKSGNQNPTKDGKLGDETARKRGETTKDPMNKQKVIGQKGAILKRLYIFAE